MSSSNRGSPEKRRSAAANKRASDKSDDSSTTPTAQQQQSSPQKQRQHKRRRRARASSSSSDGIVHEVRRDLRHMERLLLHSGKLHVFRAYFGDPTLDFYTRPDGRRRHPAGEIRNRPPPDEDRAAAALGAAAFQGAAAVDNHPLEKPLAIKVEEEEGPPSVVSSRGLSPGSSFATFPPSPPDCNADFELVPFAGLPPIRESPEHSAAAGTSRPKPKSTTSSSSVDHDDYYMASVSASDSDEPGARPNPVDANRVADRLNRMVVSNNNPPPASTPEPMSLSSDPATPRDSD